MLGRATQDRWAGVETFKKLVHWRGDWQTASLFHSQKKKRVQNVVLGYNLKNDRMISVHFQGKPFNITVFQAYAPTPNSKEAEVERFYDDL